MKKIFKKIMAVVSVSAMLLSLLPTVSMAAMKPDFNNQKRVIYIDDLGIFASVGKNGVHTSVDGINWTKRYNASGYGYEGTDIAWGGPEGNELLMVICGQNRVYTSYDLNDAGSANTSTIVWHETEDEEGNVTKDWTYLRTYPQLIWDEYSEKFYVSGVEYAKDNTTVLDYGLYCSDGIKKFNRNLGTSYNRYMEWEKVELGAADIYAEYDSNSDGTLDTRLAQGALWPNISTDNQGRIVMTTGNTTDSTTTNAAGRAPRTYIVNIKIGEDKEIEKVFGYGATITFPKVALDNMGNVLISGTYGGSPFTKPIIAKYNFDDGIETYVPEENYSYVYTSGNLPYGPNGAAYNYNAKWLYTPAAEDGSTAETWTKTGSMTGSLSANTGKQRLFEAGMGKEPVIFDVATGMDGQPFVFIAPQKGKATITDGMHNDFVMIPYTEDAETGDVAISTQYYTLINNDDTLKTLIGNGGTVKTVVDTAVSPDGKMVVMTTTDCFVIDTTKIDTTDSGATDRTAAVTNIGHNVQTDASSIEISVDKTKLSADEVSNITVVSRGLGENANGGEAEVVVDTEYTFEIVNDEADYENGLVIDLANKTITAKPGFAGVCPVTLRATSKSNSSTFAEVTFNITVCETSLTLNGKTQLFTGDSITVDLSDLKAGANTVSFENGLKAEKAYDGVFTGVALYNEGRLVDIIMSVEAVAEGALLPGVEGTFTLPQDADLSKYSMKIFVWESIINQAPL